MIITKIKIENFGNIATYEKSINRDFEVIDNMDIILVIRHFLNQYSVYSKFAKKIRINTKILIEFENKNSFVYKYEYDDEYKSFISKVKVDSFIAKGFLAEQIIEEYSRQYNSEYLFNSGKDQFDVIKRIKTKLNQQKNNIEVRDSFGHKTSAKEILNLIERFIIKNKDIEINNIKLSLNANGIWEFNVNHDIETINFYCFIKNCELINLIREKDMEYNSINSPIVSKFIEEKIEGNFNRQIIFYKE